MKAFLNASKVAFPELKDDLIEHIWCILNLGIEKLLIGCFYRALNSSKDDNTRINLLITEASKLVAKQCFTGLVISEDFNYLVIKWTDNGYPDIVTTIIAKNL